MKQRVKWGDMKPARMAGIKKYIYIYISGNNNNLSHRWFAGLSVETLYWDGIVLGGL